MSDQTFGQLWRRLKLHAPGLPIPLAQEFINTAYSKALGMGDWSGLRGEAEFVLPPIYNAGTFSVTQGATGVAGSGTAWTADMEGRQIFADGKAPFYTILRVEDPQTLFIDRPWADSTVTNGTYQIQLIYVRAPSDFLRFLRVVDPSVNWLLRTNVLQEMIDRWDPQRSNSGQAWVIAPAGFTPAGSTTISAGLRRFEVWPRAQDTFYKYTYIRKPSLLSADTDRPIFPIRGDALRAGAIAELSKWPGTAQEPNPYFDARFYQIYEEDFTRKINQCQREDQEITPTDVAYANETQFPWAPVDANFIQTHPDFIVF